MLKRLKKLVRERANGRCEYCISREDFCPDSFAAEHIVPLAKGGDDSLDNLAFPVRVVTIENTPIRKA